jgi:hypothetical protein
MEKVYADVNLSVANLAPGFSTFADVVNVVLRNAFVLAGIIAFVILVFGGFSVIMGAGAGDTKQLEKGKTAITGAVIGLLVIVVSVWLIQIIEKLTGLTILNSPL